MTTTPILGATEWAAAMASPWVAFNEGLRRAESGFSAAIVADRDLAAPPGSCADGARYLVAASATGAWSGKSGMLAIAVGANAANGWLFETIATEGFLLYVQDENLFLYYNGTSWASAGIIPGASATESIIIACSDETTALTAGTAKVTFRMPYAFTLTAVKASLTTAQGSGSIFTVDINEAGTSVLSTKLTIDNTEKTSATAATPAVISDTALADDAEITIDIDQIGDGSAKGLKVVLVGHQ